MTLSAIVARTFERSTPRPFFATATIADGQFECSSAGASCKGERSDGCGGVHSFNAVECLSGCNEMVVQERSLREGEQATMLCMNWAAVRGIIQVSSLVTDWA